MCYDSRDQQDLQIERISRRRVLQIAWVRPGPSIDDLRNMEKHEYCIAWCLGNVKKQQTHMLLNMS